MSKKKNIIGYKGTKFEKTVKELKEWTKVNFIFNKGTVYYNSYDDEKYIKLLPEDLRSDEEMYRKADFDTPLSHLMYLLLIVGRKMQVKESELALRLMADGKINEEE